MLKKTVLARFAASCMLFWAPCLTQAMAQTAAYPQMAPVAQYQMERKAEIEMAKSAAPASISGDAQILVMGRTGYEEAVPGKNGFVCFVQRSWASGVSDPEFWNPKLRAPICLNAAAAGSLLPHLTKKAEWALAGLSKEQIAAKIQEAVRDGQFPAVAPGAMSYMMSKEGYLNDHDGHWHPHLMFFTAAADPASWGANLTGSPLSAGTDKAEGFTVYFLPIANWSDGSADEGSDQKH